MGYSATEDPGVASSDHESAGLRGLRVSRQSSNVSRNQSREWVIRTKIGFTITKQRGLNVKLEHGLPWECVQRRQPLK